jgi:hypothetical protein
VFSLTASAIPDRAALALLVPVADSLLALAVVFPLAPTADFLPAQVVVSRPGLAVGSLLALAAVFPLVPAADSQLALVVASPLVPAVVFQPALVVVFPMALAIIGAACPCHRDIDCKTFKRKSESQCWRDGESPA